MCGRFSQYWSLEEWTHAWPVQWRTPDYAARYNVAPGTLMLALVHQAGAHTVGGAIRWGMQMPHGLVVNARCETIAVLPRFRALLPRHRLIIPMNGYYEWHQQTKQPYYLYSASDEPLWALGLYQITPDGARAVILTRDAAASLAIIHKRMPLLADRQSAAQWLQDNALQSIKLIQQLENQDPSLQFHAVSKRVNSTRHEGPELIEMVEEAHRYEDGADT